MKKKRQGGGNDPGGRGGGGKGGRGKVQARPDIGYRRGGEHGTRGGEGEDSAVVSEDGGGAEACEPTSSNLWPAVGRLLTRDRPAIGRAHVPAVGPLLEPAVGPLLSLRGVRVERLQRGMGMSER